MPTQNYRDLTVQYKNKHEYETLLEEIFKKHTYYLDLETNTPLIIDAGAHIGLSTLYFHSLYSQASFICIEPDPVNLTYLYENLKENRVEHAVVVPKALVGNPTLEYVVLHTHPTHSVLSSLHKGSWTGKEQTVAVQVEATTLSAVVDTHAKNKSIDVLKIDIEGMETAVLWQAKQLLPRVKHLIVEFHKTRTHALDDLLPLLQHHFKTIRLDKDKKDSYGNQLVLIEASR